MSKLPIEFQGYFWDCDFKKLSWPKYSFYITERLLNFGNMQILHWLQKHTTQKELKKVIKESRALDPKTQNFWKKIYS
jgi:hypothetical protein